MTYYREHLSYVVDLARNQDRSRQICLCQSDLFSVPAKHEMPVPDEVVIP